MLRFNVPPFPSFIAGGSASFRKGYKHFKRTFNVFDLIYVKQGTLFMTEGEEKYSVSEGEYIILAPGLQHFGHLECEENTPIFWMHFSLDQGYQLTKKKNVDWSDIYNRENSYTDAANFCFQIPRYGRCETRVMIEQQLSKLVSLNTVGNPEEKLKQQILFYEFIIQLQKEAIHIPTAAEQLTAQVIHYIQKHYHEPIKMRDLSRTLLFHPDYIVRSMKKTLGVSPMQYLTKYRLFLAKNELSNTSDKISVIAARVGIEDTAYFSKLFKKEEGMSATAYQRLIKKK